VSLAILCIGDVVGKPGRRVLADHLPDLITEHHIDLVVCNAENAAGGSGITKAIYKKLFNYGVDVVTFGDHVFRKPDAVEILRDSDRAVRPANLSPKAVGRRWTLAATKDGSARVAVACLLGQLYMGANDSPWLTADQLLQEMPASVKVRVLDFHAEATSEKIAMGWHLAGRASVVFGTHTHVPTADARILDGGTAYVSDVGMTGPYGGVLGRKKDSVLYALRTSMYAPFPIATEDPRLCGLLVHVDPETGKALDCTRLEVHGTARDGDAYDADDGRPAKG
jgi:hypothetical protein